MTSGRSLLLLGALLLLSSSCSKRSTPEVGGSESHWLAECSDSDDCGEELDCICGACTRLCSMDEACGGDIPALCYERSSPVLVRRCEGTAVEQSAGVCLRGCVESAECGESQLCVFGACVPRLASEWDDVPDGGVSDAGGGLSRDELDELLSMDTDIDYGAPVASPPLLSGVSGGDERITGRWIEQGCDPGAPDVNRSWGCVRLTLERDAADAVTGTIQIARTASIDGLLDPIPPFPPAEDPDVGYPPGMEPVLYDQYVWNFGPGIPYRVLDGDFDGTRLRFAWSASDLWQDWCVLQKSHRWMIDDHAFSFCVPQDRALWTELDEAKIVLCTSAGFEPLCSAGGALIPCPCLEDGNPRCSPAYCRCDDAGCQANLRFLNRVELSLSLDGEAMTGSWSGGTYDWSGTLRRLSP